MEFTAKYRHQIIGEPSRYIEESFLTGRLPVDNCCFDQVARTVELMQITKVFETVTRTPGQYVAIEVTIGLLGARQEFDGPLHDCFEFRVFPMLQIGARCL